MSIFKALVNGIPVYANQGEELRNKDVVCKDCGAHMHPQKYPGRKEYYFSLNPFNEHTQEACLRYSGKVNAPVIINTTPEELITAFCTPTKKRVGGTKEVEEGETEEVEEGETEEVDTNDNNFKPRKLTRLKQILLAAFFNENPFHLTYENEKYRFIDYVIFAKWACIIWKDKRSVIIGPRVIDGRWIGSFQYKGNLIKTITDKMKATKEIWLTTYWKGSDGKYVNVRFCLDCNDCFGDVKRKIFDTAVRDNGTVYDFVPKEDPLELLVAGKYGQMSRDQCGEKCPLKASKEQNDEKKTTFCDNCLAAYWCKIVTPKQIVLFTAADRKGSR